MTVPTPPSNRVTRVELFRRMPVGGTANLTPKETPVIDPMHRNGCTGCEHDQAAYPSCWTEEQVLVSERVLDGLVRGRVPIGRSVEVQTETSTDPELYGTPEENRVGVIRWYGGSAFIKLDEPASEPWHVVLSMGQQDVSGWQSNEDMAGTPIAGYAPLRYCLRLASLSNDDAALPIVERAAKVAHDASCGCVDYTEHGDEDSSYVQQAEAQYAAGLLASTAPPAPQPEATSNRSEIWQTSTATFWRDAVTGQVFDLQPDEEYPSLPADATRLVNADLRPLRRILAGKPAARYPEDLPVPSPEDLEKPNG